MPPANVEVTVLIIDAGLTASEKDEKDERSFFETARSCLCRIIERKIFSRPNDQVSVVVMGSQGNDPRADLVCENIDVFSELGEPTWELIENIAKNIKTSDRESSWIGALKISAHLMENVGNVSNKKVVLMSDLKKCPEIDDIDLENLVQMYKEKDLELFVIGPDIWTDDSSNKSVDQQKNERIIQGLVSEMNVITSSFEEAIEQLTFVKKKATKPTPWNINLSIGTKISIPVSGYCKIRDDKIVGQWRKSYKDLANNNVTGSIARTGSFFMKEDNTVSVDNLDIISGYLYGQTIIPFSKMDSAMEYKSGPACLSVYGFTKRCYINWNNLSGDGVTFVVARKDDDKAKVALDAFIMALNELELVAIARKVYRNNLAAHMNVLIPVIEEDFKCLSMINLAFKEDYRHIAFPSLNKKKNAANDEQIKAVDDLIDSLNLSNIDDKEKEYLSIDNCVNPTIQHFFDTLSYRALHPNEPLPPPRPEIQALLQIPEPLTKLMREPLDAVKKNFDLVIHEKVKTGKYWINQHLKQEDKPSENDIATEKKTNGALSAGSVMASQITRIGTIQPSEDFKELLSNGEPLESICDQTKEVIERLVFQTLGSNYNKPISTLKVMREECVNVNPSIFNNWIIQFKNVLLERSKIDFFQIITDKNLGLISKEENPDSTATASNIASFYNTQSNQIKDNLEDINDMDIDELFD